MKRMINIIIDRKKKEIMSKRYFKKKSFYETKVEGKGTTKHIKKLHKKIILKP